MAITTLDGVIAGLQMPRALAKTGGTMASAGGMRAYTPWYANGNPGAATANSVGVDGAAVSGAVSGAIPRSNPVSGNAYIANMSFQATQPGQLWIIDRLWHNSGLSATLTSAQAISPAALPARDLNASTNGAGVFAGIEWSATGGAGTPTVTLSYTNQSGTAGQTATLSAVTTPPAGTMEIFTLAAGDTGIRSVQSYTSNATRTSGTFHLVLFRVVATVSLSGTNVGNDKDAITLGLPRVYDDSVLQMLWFNSSTAAANFSGLYQEAHG